MLVAITVMGSVAVAPLPVIVRNHVPATSERERNDTLPEFAQTPAIVVQSVVVTENQPLSYARRSFVRKEDSRPVV